MATEPLYTVEITFHSAENLPLADILTLSCDPYISAKLYTHPTAHPLTWRTPTIHRTRDPSWNASWFVAAVPAAGFTLSITLIDEDTDDRDDRLGKADAHFAPLNDAFLLAHKKLKIEKRRGSFRSWIQTYLVALLPGQHIRKHNRLVLSVRVLGRTHNQHDTRPYTLGPNTWSQHFSPLIGRVINNRAQQPAADHSTDLAASAFVANKLQLTGPVPPELHHDYVPFRPLIRLLFDNIGIRGRILNRGLRKQYRTIYSYDKNTVYGVVPLDDRTDADEIVSATTTLPHWAPASRLLARQFLDMSHWGAGARLYTYVITLDAEWRFTETGDEFAVDLLSKHSMHADAARSIAFSGEFFVRRFHHSPGESESNTADHNRDPAHYELVIDNDSGTYRPKKHLLPTLQAWLSSPYRLGALGRVVALDAFDDSLKEMKHARKDEKKRLAGGDSGQVPPRVGVRRSGSSVSSVAAEALGHHQSLSSAQVETVLSSGWTPHDAEEKVVRDNVHDAQPPDSAIEL